MSHCYHNVLAASQTFIENHQKQIANELDNMSCDALILVSPFVLGYPGGQLMARLLVPLVHHCPRRNKVVSNMGTKTCKKVVTPLVWRHQRSRHIAFFEPDA